MPCFLPAGLHCAVQQQRGLAEHGRRNAAKEVCVAGIAKRHLGQAATPSVDGGHQHDVSRVADLRCDMCRQSLSRCQGSSLDTLQLFPVNFGIVAF